MSLKKNALWTWRQGSSLEVAAARVEEDIGNAPAVDLVEQSIHQTPDASEEEGWVILSDRSELLDVDQRIRYSAIRKELLNMRLREVGHVPRRQPGDALSVQEGGYVGGA